MIDLHFHLLPGVDDGPSTVADAVALAAVAVEAGADAIVATPHIDDYWQVLPADVEPAIAKLTIALAEAGVNVSVHRGGEVALSRLLALAPGEADAVRLGDGPYLLIESPHSAVAGAFDAVVLDLLGRGEKIVLAHPERCPVFQRRPELLERLIAAGALSSITAASMYGRFGRTVRNFAIDLLRAGLVHNVASDAHDLVGRRPGLIEAFAAVEPQIPGIGRRADWMTCVVPAAILAGAPIPPPPRLPSTAAATGARRSRSRWRRKS